MTKTGKQPLGTISPKEFLKTYWQKKPALIRGAYPIVPELPTPEELAGLSCDPRAHSRIIVEKGGKVPWEVQTGPFSDKTFKRLPKTHWTLLVNSVERFLPEVHALLNDFTFLPNWRLDDIMISYAVKGGNVGAHVDNFDVFLIQVRGEREWSIEEKPRLDDDYKPGLKVRLLKKFKPSQTWTLKPGDLLYLPPRVPHHGVALTDDCMTVSVGFRAPTEKEIVSSAFSSFLSDMHEGPRYSDPDLQLGPPGEISESAIAKINNVLTKACSDPLLLRRWFGAWTSYSDAEKKKPRWPFTWSQVRSKLSGGSGLCRNEGSRLMYTTHKDVVLLFADGETIELPKADKAFAQVVTTGTGLDNAEVKRRLTTKGAQGALVALLNSGALYFED